MVLVVIDPGHGGAANKHGSSWNNAKGPNGTLEKDLTLAVGHAAKFYLNNAGVDAAMTRTTDVNVGIRDRAAVAKQAKAEIFVSIHFNAPNKHKPPAQGTETWVAKDATKKSRLLAGYIQKSVKSETGYRDRGIKYSDDLGVISNKNHSDRTAHCLVEISFIDRQPEDEKRLLDPAYIDRLGNSISSGAISYLTHEGISANVQDSMVSGIGSQPGIHTTEIAADNLDKYNISSNIPDDDETILANVNSRMIIARQIVDFEARRDNKGNLAVYELPPGDGGGRYEVAGINERYHKEVCDNLVELINSKNYTGAEKHAAEFIANYTDGVISWCSETAVEAFLRDCAFNRGLGGAAWIVQDAVEVERDRVVGPKTREAVANRSSRPKKLLKDLRVSRERYERDVIGRNEKSKFWKGLVNRWDKAYKFATTFLKSDTYEALSEFRSTPFALGTLGPKAPIVEDVDAVSISAASIALRENESDDESDGDEDAVNSHYLVVSGAEEPTFRSRVASIRSLENDGFGDSDINLYSINARDGLNLRAGPGVEFAVIRNIGFGSLVRLLKRYGEWGLIDEEGDGATDGFVHLAYIDRWHREESSVGEPLSDGDARTFWLTRNPRGGKLYDRHGTPLVDPRLLHATAVGIGNFEISNAATRVEIYGPGGGFRSGGSTRNHTAQSRTGRGAALDLVIIDTKTDEMLTNHPGRRHQNQGTVGQNAPMYQKLYNEVVKAGSNVYGGFDAEARFGGYFAGGANAMDTMHIDMRGREIGTAGGNLRQGFSPQQMRRWNIPTNYPYT